MSAPSSDLATVAVLWLPYALTHFKHFLHGHRGGNLNPPVSALISPVVNYQLAASAPQASGCGAPLRR